MKFDKRLLAVIAAVVLIASALTSSLLLAQAPTATFVTQDDDDADNADDDTPITGDALEQASAAALAHVGQGQVVDSEIDGDEEGYYEVEIALDDGSQIEVNLDQNFNVLSQETEDSESDD